LWHISLGLPKSDKKTIIDRWNICSSNSCGSFDAENSQCKECGCYLSDKSKFLNKLAWADQECPLNMWSKTI
jgi:hypothetical protein